MQLKKSMRLNHGSKLKRYAPMRIIFISYLVLILVGACFLYLPVSQNDIKEELSFLDCIFTATSAVCVTGLVVVPTAVHWSLFGKIVLLCLIQIGGLSIITITSFIYVILGKKIGFKDRMLLQNTFNQNQVGGIVKLTKTVVMGTLLFESIGALILATYFIVAKKFSFSFGIFAGIFHAISAFCNAGFDILGVNSIMDYSADLVVNLVLMSLIILGGIGFFVWHDAYLLLRKKKKKLHLTSRIAIYSTILIVFGGALYFFLIEYNNPETLGNLSMGNKALASFFQSVTLRTAGYYSIDQNGLHEVSKFVSSILMMIGGSPGGIAGGIKTVTVAVLIASIWNTIKGNDEIELMNRSFSMKTLCKALAVAGLMMFLVIIFSVVLSITEMQSAFSHTFVDIIYECASALGTVGLTTGITPFLSNIGKSLISLAMLIGRAGPITVIYAFTSPRANQTMKLPEIDLLIG